MIAIIVIMVIGIMLLLSSWEDYRGDGGGFRHLVGSTMLLVGGGFLVIYTLASLLAFSMGAN